MENHNDPNTKPAENQPLVHHFFRSKTFMVVVVILAELILLMGAFNLGMKVAFHKARYTYSWMSNYPNNFGMLPGPGGRFMDHNPGDHEFINANGVFGQIISNNGSTLTIKGIDNNEKTVNVTGSTTIRKGFTDVKATDLKPGDQVVVIGEANDKGQIDAKLIRVLNP